MEYDEILSALKSKETIYLGLKAVRVFSITSVEDELCITLVNISGKYKEHIYDPKALSQHPPKTFYDLLPFPVNWHSETARKMFLDTVHELRTEYRQELKSIKAHGH